MVILDDGQETTPDAIPAEAEVELEERRIRQIVRSRRAVVRIRGWYAVGMLAAVILAVQQLTWFVAAGVRGMWDTRQMARLSLAIALITIAGWLWRRVRGLTAELGRRGLPEPTSPPDFTSLSDGSQQARNLEKLDQGE